MSFLPFRTKKILKLDLFSNNKFLMENLIISALDEKKNLLEIGLLSHSSQSVTFQIIPEIEGNISIVPKVPIYCNDSLKRNSLDNILLAKQC